MFATTDGGAVAEITALLDAATGRILGGDGGGWKDLVSGQEDVTLLGAYGGHTTGRAEVATRFDYVAGTYAGADGTTRRYCGPLEAVDILIAERASDELPS